MHKHHPLYNSWVNMRQRCNNPNNPSYHNYGGRGIMVCPEWEASFETFLSDVGERPNPRMTLDRIDNEKGYSPGNIRWATKQDQANNMRPNLLVTAFGRTQTLAEWSRETGISQNALHLRLKRGVAHEEAVSQPMRPGLPWKARTGAKLTLNGVTQSAKQWALQHGKSPTHLKRLMDQGLTLEQALARPVREKRPNGQAKRPRKPKLKRA